MSLTNPVRWCLLALLGQYAVCQMTVTGFAYEDGAINSETLRGDPRGNIWNTPVPGSNILQCGIFGNRAYYGVRAGVDAGGNFQLHGNIFVARLGTGSVYLSIKYGSEPRFASDGVPLGVPWAIGNLQEYTLEEFWKDPKDPYKWTLSTSIPSDAYASDATIQVEYTTPHGVTGVNGTVYTYYQCIDINIVPGGTSRSVPPGGFPSGGSGLPPTPAPVPVTPDEKGVALVPVVSQTVTDFTIALICLVVVMLIILVIVLFIKCKKKQDDDDELEFDAEFDVTEQQYGMNMQQQMSPQDIAQAQLESHLPPRSPTPTTPPIEQKYGQPVIHGHHMFSPKNVEYEQYENESQYSNTGATNAGRNFHFHYVED